MNGIKVIMVKRDPDANLNSYDPAEVTFDEFKTVTVKDCIDKCKDELDLTDNDVARMTPFHNGTQCLMGTVVAHDDVITLKSGSKDNG